LRGFPSEKKDEIPTYAEYSGENMIKVEGLSKHYGERIAINNLTFHADKGEVVGFLGPNGAGKTTTMRILTGYMPATTGSVTIAGFDIFTDSLEARRQIGYLPENVPLYEDMKVWQYLDYLGDLRSVPNRGERVEAVMGLVGMTERAESFISNLSKGMRQRVGLAQAILHQPKVLILDEPTVGLDPIQKRDVLELIRELGKDCTVMFSTHILSEAQAICNRLLIINNGQIVAEDSPEKLQRRMTGGERVKVSVAGDADGLMSLFKELSWLAGIRSISSNSFELDLPGGGKDMRPAIARLVVENGYELLELRTMDMNLEQIYLQLIRSDTEASNQAHS
jgi:ABC-2 type transport system ATP-binding protein